MKTQEEIQDLLDKTDKEIDFLTSYFSRPIGFDGVESVIRRLKNMNRDKQLLQWILEEVNDPPDID